MGRRNNDDGMLECIAYILLGLFFMPFIGLFLIGGKDPDRRILGWILLIAGIILWIILGLGR